MAFTLVVVRGFGARRAGDLIEDEDEVLELLSGEHASDVVRVTRPPVGAEQGG